VQASGCRLTNELAARIRGWLVNWLVGFISVSALGTITATYSNPRHRTDPE